MGLRHHPVEPVFPIPFDPHYPEIALRGLVAMIPKMRIYLDRIPKPSVDGGYYTKTRENRPLIGPLPVEGAYVIGALSGFGIMAAYHQANCWPLISPAARCPTIRPVSGWSATMTLDNGGGGLPYPRQFQDDKRRLLDPLPKGKTRTLPEIDWPKSSWRGSLTHPVMGSTPPQKLIG